MEGGRKKGRERERDREREDVKSDSHAVPAEQRGTTF